MDRSREREREPHIYTGRQTNIQVYRLNTKIVNERETFLIRITGYWRSVRLGGETGSEEEEDGEGERQMYKLKW